MIPPRLSTAVIGGALLAALVVGLIARTHGLVAIAVPCVVLAGTVLFARPVIGLFLFAAMIPVESALMVGGRSLAALVGMTVFGVWATQKLLRREPLLSLVSSGLVQLAVLLFAFACLSLVWAFQPQGVARQLILLFQLILLCVLVLDLASSWERIAWVAKFLVLAGIVAALFTVEQYFLGGVRRAGEGVTGGINRTAMTLVTILPFAFFLWRSRESTPWRMLGLAYIGLSAVAVAATLSRMNFLLFPLVVAAHLALMARVSSERRRVLALGAIAVVTVSFLPMEAFRDRAETIIPYLSGTAGTDDSIESYSARGYLMRIGVEMFKDYPLLGSGYDNFRRQVDLYQWRVSRSPYEYVYPGRSPHSSHLAMLVGLGIVGFLMWLGLFGIGLVYVWRVGREAPDPTSHRALLSQAIAIAIVLQVIYGFYGLVHTDKIVWLVLGLAAAVRTLHLATDSRVDGPSRLATTSRHLLNLPPRRGGFERGRPVPQGHGMVR